LRAALEWSLNNDIDLGLQTANALAWFWQLHGHAVEGAQQMARLLEAGPPAATLLYAKALNWAAWLIGFAHYDERAITLATTSLTLSNELGYLEGQGFSNLTLANQLFHFGDYDQALLPAEAGLAQLEQIGIPWSIRHALGMVGYIRRAQGDYERAHTLFQKSLSLSRSIGDIDGISWSLYLLGNLAALRGNFEQAMAYYQESLPLAREVRNKPLISWIRAFMGDTVIHLGDSEQGIALLEESAVLMQELGDYPFMAGVLSRLGRLARLQGEYDQATKYYSESLKLAWKNAGLDTVARGIAGLAELNALSGQPHKAARLLAAVQDLTEVYGYIWQYVLSDWQRELGQILDTVRARLAEPAFQAEQELGRQMSLEDAVALALEGVTE
jgi:tetratricopeptide (TPR) repeat protein